MKTCGLDVHKDMIFCAIYDGKDSVVKKYDTFTSDLEAMCDDIKVEGVDTVAMESTGIYISAVRTVLRHRGMRAVVVNPYLIKQMPGRKSDVKDSVWIATLMYNRMLSDSFLPDGALAQLRVYTRDYRRSVQRRDSTLTLIDQLLVGMGIRLSSCLSKITTKSFRRVAEAVAGGETNPEKLEELVHGCLKHKRDGTLRKALAGCCEGQDLWRLKRRMKELEMYETQIEDALTHMEELADTNYREAAVIIHDEGTIPVTMINTQKGEVQAIINGMQMPMLIDERFKEPIAISWEEAMNMLYQRRINKEDFPDRDHAFDPEGNILDRAKLVFKEIQIGQKHLYNVETIVVKGIDYKFIINRAALGDFGEYEFDKQRGQLYFFDE